MRTCGILTLTWLWILSVATAATAANNRAPGAAEEATASSLVLLFTHDLHSHLTPFRVVLTNGKTEERGGFARLASAIREERQAARERRPDASLLVDAGDFSMGTPFHTLFTTESTELSEMAAMGYDAVTFGNHEFDFHPDGLARALEAARNHLGAGVYTRPTLVAANIVLSKQDGPLQGDASLKTQFAAWPVQRHVVVSRAGLKIGIFGLIGRDAAGDSPFASPVTFADAIESAREEVRRLRDDEKVDVVICLSHSGTAYDKARSEDEILANRAPGIDVIISGHTHTLLPRPIEVSNGGRTTWIVSAGSYGRYLGVLDLSVSRQPAGVTPRAYRLREITPDIQEDRAIASDVASFQERLDRVYFGQFGYRGRQLLTRSDFDFEPLWHTHQHPGESGLGDLITDAFRYAIRKAEGPGYRPIDLVVQPQGNIRDSLLAGPVTVEDAFRVLSLGIGPDGIPGYPLLAFYVRGAEIKDLLEVETTLSAIKGDAHLQLSGVNFHYNPNRVPFDRVTDMTTDGGAIISGNPRDPDRLYRVAMNLYAARMIGYASRLSHGLLRLVPKNADGTPLKDPAEAIIYTHSRELKEWVALAQYLQSSPSVPDGYRQPAGRFSAVPSWNPIRLMAGGNGVTLIVSGLVAAALGLCTGTFVMLGRWGRRRLKTKHGA